MKKGRAVTTTVAAVVVIVIVAAAGGIYYYYAQVSTTPQKTIGVVFDIGGRGDLSFNDMAALGADNAARSPFFGNVYVCYAAFRGQEKGHALPAPLQVAVSRDGGDTWTLHQISAAADNSQRNPMDGCTIRTDSHGNAYVFGVGTLRLAPSRARDLKDDIFLTGKASSSNFGGSF